jgi:hypothetical protein
VGTIALYLPGYNFHDNGCLSGCTPGVALRHPVTVTKFFFALIGNVVPGGVLFFPSVHNYGRFELVGVVLFAAAVFIVVQSWRLRDGEERLPLPLLLIGFSLSFDVTIALGRGGTGPAGAVAGNRYVMPNLILLTAIIIFAWKHRPTLRSPARNTIPRLALVVLAIFLIVQVKESVGFGRANGAVVRSAWTASARYFVNSDRLPAQDRACYQGQALFFQAGALPSFASRLHMAESDGLGEFEPNAYRYFRRLGPPPDLFGGCSKAPSAGGSSAART